MNIRPGDIFWLTIDASIGSGAAHPHVVVQADAGDPAVVLACALTTNLKRAALPGNILLDAGEGGLPRQSVAEVSKCVQVDTTRLGSYIGTLSERRVRQIVAGRRFVDTAFRPR